MWVAIIETKYLPEASLDNHGICKIGDRHVFKAISTIPLPFRMVSHSYCISIKRDIS